MTEKPQKVEVTRVKQHVSILAAYVRVVTVQTGDPHIVDDIARLERVRRDKAADVEIELREVVRRK